MSTRGSTNWRSTREPPPSKRPRGEATVNFVATSEDTVARTRNDGRLLRLPIQGHSRRLAACSLDACAGCQGCQRHRHRQGPRGTGGAQACRAQCGERRQGGMTATLRHLLEGHGLGVVSPARDDSHALRTTRSAPAKAAIAKTASACDDRGRWGQPCANTTCVDSRDVSETAKLLHEAPDAHA